MRIYFNHKEELWNSWSHAAGIVLGVVIGIVFTVWCTRSGNPWATAGVSLYLFGMIASYAASTIYHALSAWAKWKERLRRWTKKARKDPAYRAKCNERQRARQQQLIADAEFGRMARAFVGNLARMLVEWANLRDFVVGAGEGFGKHGVARDAAQDGRGWDAASTGKEAV